MLKAPSISPKVYSLTPELCDLVQSLIHKQWFNLPGQCFQCVPWMIQGSVVSEERPSGRAGLFPGSGGSGVGSYPPETRCSFATSLFS